MGFGVPSSSIATTTTVANPNDIATAIAGSALPQNTATAVQQTGVKTVDQQGAAQNQSGGQVAIGGVVTLLNQVDVRAFNSIAIQLNTVRVMEVTFTWYDSTGVFIIFEKTWETWEMVAGESVQILDNHYGQLLTLTIKNIDTVSNPTDHWGVVIFQSNRVLPGEACINQRSASPYSNMPDEYLISDNAVVPANTTALEAACGLIVGGVAIQLFASTTVQFLWRWGLAQQQHFVNMAANQVMTMQLFGPRRVLYYQKKNTDVANPATFRVNIVHSPRNF